MNSGKSRNKSPNLRGYDEFCLVKTLLVAATAFELAPFRDLYPATSCWVTGVGVPLTVATLMQQLIGSDTGRVIQVGIAGLYRASMAESEAYLVRRDRFADIGVQESGGFRSLFDLSLASADERPFSEGWICNPDVDQLPERFPRADALTLNRLSDDIAYHQSLGSSFGALLETMEGAAFHLVCRQLHLPFLQVRGVSNVAGDRDKSRWNMDGALNACLHLCRDYLDHLAES